MSTIKKVAELVVRAKDAATPALGRIDKAWRRYIRSVEGASKANRRLDGSAKKAGKGVDGLDKSVKKSTKDIAKFQNTIGKLVADFTQLVAAGAAVVLPIAEAAKFNRAMSEVRAVMGEVSDKQFTKLTTRAKELGEATEFTGIQAAQGMKFLAMAGLTAAEAFDAIPGMLELAQAGSLELGKAADIATNVLTGMGLEVSELTRVGDVLTQTFTSTNSSLGELGYAMSYVAPVASGLGVSLEDTATALGLLHNAGIKGSMAGTTLRGILTRLSAPTSSAANLMEELGSRIGQTTIQLYDSQGAFIGVKALIKQFEDSGASATEVMALLGQRAGPGMLALLKQGSKGFAELNQSVHESGGRMAEVSEMMHDNLVGDFKSFQSAIAETVRALGETLIPTARKVMQVVTAVITRFNKFVRENPKTVTAITHLVAALATLVAAMSVIKMAVGLKTLASFGWAALTAQAAALGTTFLAMSKKVIAALKIVSLGHPYIAAITIALGAAIAAWQWYKKYVADAAKTHSKASKELSKTRKVLSDEREELEKLRDVLQDPKTKGDELIKAQERLAELLPDASVKFDEQGRVLAPLGEQYSDNADKLRDYLYKLEGEENLTFANQLREQAAAMKASKDNMTEYVGKLGAAGKDFKKYSKEGEELRKTNKKITNDFNLLLSEANKAGLSVEELGTMLGMAGTSGEVEEFVLESYVKMRAAVEDTSKSILDFKTVTRTMTLEEAQAEIESYKEEVNNLEQAHKEAKDASVQGLKAISNAYGELATLAQESYETQIEGIDAVHKARMQSIADSGMSEGARIVAETEEIVRAYKDRAKAFSEYVSESIEASQLEEQYQRARSGKLSESETLAFDRQILEGRKAIYQQTLSAYESMIDGMNAEENKHLDAVRRIEEEKLALKGSFEDKLRSLRRKSMSEDEKHQDDLNRAEELLSKARQARQAEEYEEAKKYAQQSLDLAATTAKSKSEIEAALREEATKDGKELTDKDKELIGAKAARLEQESIAAATDRTREAYNLLNGIIDDSAEKHKKSAETIRSQSEALEVGFTKAKKSLQGLNTQLGALSAAKIELNTTAVDEALKKMTELETRLESIANKTYNARVIVSESTTEQKATGGVVGGFKRLASAVVRGGRGAVDDVRAMLTQGEFVQPVAAVKKYGVGFMDRIRRGVVPVGEALKLAEGGPVGAITFNPNLVSSLGSLSPGQEYTSKVHNNTNHSTTNHNSTVIKVDGIGKTPSNDVKDKAQKLMDAVIRGQ